MLKESLSKPHAVSVLDVVEDSLIRCGFCRGDFQLSVVQALPGKRGTTVIAQMFWSHPTLWALAGSLEAYVVDRVYRHAGYEISQIVFSPARKARVPIESARREVRKIYELLTSAQERRMMETTGGWTVRTNSLDQALLGNMPGN